MVPDLEALGIRMLLNECIAIDRGGALIYLAGVDDAHFYRADNIEKAATEIPQGYVSILLSHTPEIYRQAAHAGFALMLSGPRTAGRSACPAAFLSCLKPICPALPVLAHGDMPAWPAIPQWGRNPPSSRFVSTIGRRSRCTSLCAASLSRDDPTKPMAKSSLRNRQLPDQEHKHTSRGTPRRQSPFLDHGIRKEKPSASQARGLTHRLLSLHTCVPLGEGACMTNTVGIPGDRICSFIERVEHIDEEIKALNEGKKEVFSEAKGEGFDVKVLREILRLRKQDKEDRDEQDTLLDLYLRAMESAGSSRAEAA
jgi:uncharacterized protein (UPF0335 family)